jgi:hypothetical protein
VEATEVDLAMARDGLTLITERGFDRGKNLQTDLDALLARFRPND